MAQTALRCPKCQKSMELGHLPDVGYGVAVQSTWAAGPPVVRRFFGGIKMMSAQLLPIGAYRCVGCGYVELYAPSV